MNILGDSSVVWLAETVHAAAQAVAINVVSCILLSLVENGILHFRNNSH
jgi:hypothetical protein